jgi:hypothetical protein
VSRSGTRVCRSEAQRSAHSSWDWPDRRSVRGGEEEEESARAALSRRTSKKTVPAADPSWPPSSGKPGRRRSRIGISCAQSRAGRSMNRSAKEGASCDRSTSGVVRRRALIISMPRRGCVLLQLEPERGRSCMILFGTCTGSRSTRVRPSELSPPSATFSVPCSAQAGGPRYPPHPTTTDRPIAPIRRPCLASVCSRRAPSHASLVSPRLARTIFV